MTSHLPARYRGIVILYATIALAMLGVLGVSLTDGSQSTMDAVQSSTYAQLARYAAESGIEYACSAMDSHLVQSCPTFDPSKIPPISNDRLNPACAGASFNPCSASNAQSVGWAFPGGQPGDPEQICPDGTLKNSQQNLSPNGWGTDTPTLVATTESDVERCAARYAMSFRLACSPTFNSNNVYNRIFNSSPPVQAIFHIRARGMVRGGADPNNPGEPLLLGHCTLVAKVRVGSANCTTPGQLGGRARIQRISMDIVPNASNDRPRDPAIDYEPFPTVTQPH